MKRIHMILLCIIGICLIFPAKASAEDPKAREIMTKVHARNDGDNEITELKMILIDQQGKERVRDMKSYVKDKGEDTLRLMFFLSPADVKDTAFLTYDYDDPDKDDDQWLYLPALKKSKRIASSDKDNSFMGSDFSYADMTKPDIENYDYTIIKEDKVRGEDVWVIKAVPRTEKVVEEYGYTQSVAFVRKDIFMVVRAVHWVKEGNKLKYMDIESIKQIDGVWTPVKTEMTTKQGKLTLHKTILSRENIRFNQNLDENFFTIMQMEKGM